MKHAMTPEHRLRIKKNFAALVNEMQMEYMLPYLYQDGAISLEMMEDIKNSRTSFAMNDKLLKILPYRGDNSYQALIGSLKYGSGQMHLIDLLEKTEISATEIDEYKAEYYRRGSETPSCHDDTDHIISQHFRDKVVPPSAISRKKRLTKRRPSKKRSHSEDLPSISYLFPYVIPHVHTKWRQLAIELGITPKELDNVVETPHGKQSRYAQIILDLWLDKKREKATKNKLITALQAVGLKKAIDAIAIYNVPKFKAKSVRKSSIANVSPEKTVPNKPLLNLYLVNSNKKPVIAESQRRPPSKRPMKGYLPIKCEIKKISSSTHDYTQKAFLNLADKITDSMVEQGDDVTKILNTVERLQGIVFQSVYKGSIILETRVCHLQALDCLMKMYVTDELSGIMEQVFVTPQLLNQYSAVEVKLKVEIADSDYESCKAELLPADVDSCYSMEESLTDSDVNITSEASDFSAAEDPFIEEVNKDVLYCKQLVREVAADLNRLHSQFNKSVSELLMTLQIVHPLSIKKISSIEHLNMFKECLLQHHNTLSPVSIDLYINMHCSFKEKVSALKEKIAIRLFENDMDMESPRPIDPKVKEIYERLVEVERFLQPGYDFSSLIHPRTVQMTTLETLSYSGLLSYHHILLDKLQEILDL